MLPNLGALSLNAPNETHDAVPTDVVLDDWREAIRRHEDPDDEFRLPDGVEEEDDCPMCLGPLKGRPGDARVGSGGSDDEDDEGDRRVAVLDCKHAFHYQCAANWFRSNRNNSCAQCRKDVSSQDERDLRALPYAHQPLSGGSTVPDSYPSDDPSTDDDQNSESDSDERQRRPYPLTEFEREFPDAPYLGSDFMVSRQAFGVFDGELWPPLRSRVPQYTYRPDWRHNAPEDAHFFEQVMPELHTIVPSELLDRHPLNSTYILTTTLVHAKAVGCRALAYILQARLEGVQEEIRQGPPPEVMPGYEERRQQLSQQLAQARENAENFAVRVGLRPDGQMRQFQESVVSEVDESPVCKQLVGAYRWLQNYQRLAGYRENLDTYLEKRTDFVTYALGYFFTWETAAGLPPTATYRAKLMDIARSVAGLYGIDLEAPMQE
jgi:hypothetical protein